MQRQPHTDANEDRGDENNEPHTWILKKHRLAAGFDGDDDRGRGRPQQIVRCIDLDRIAAPHPDHKIREDDRQTECDQRLAEILALHPAKDEELHGRSDGGATKEGDDVAQEPRVGPLRGLVAHIAAEQIERAVREVDVAHQAEDQREAGGDEKIEAPESDAVEERVDEKTLLAEHVLEARRPGRQDEPERKDDGNGNDQRRQRVAADPAGHSVAAAGATHRFLIAKRCRHLQRLPWSFLPKATRAEAPSHAQ